MMVKSVLFLKQTYEVLTCTKSTLKGNKNKYCCMVENGQSKEPKKFFAFLKM